MGKGKGKVWCGYYIPWDTANRLRMVCARMRIPMSKAITDALQPWLDHAEQSNTNVTAQVNQVNQ